MVDVRFLERRLGSGVTARIVRHWPGSALASELSLLF